MFLYCLRQLNPIYRNSYYHARLCSRLSTVKYAQIAERVVESRVENSKPISPILITTTNSAIEDMIPTAPAIHYSNDPIVLPFDDVPGPKSLKYFSTVRQYLSELGTQITAGALRFSINLGSLVNTGNQNYISALFDHYGPVVRFVSPVGRDIVLINNPDHIQKVYAAEGDYPVRSALDSLDSYRQESTNKIYRGLYSVRGEDWSTRRSVVYAPLQNAITDHVKDLNDTCEIFCQKLYNLRNQQDEIPKNLYNEMQKWAFDCIGLIIFAKKFGTLEMEAVNSQRDGTWLFYSLEKASEAISKCESGTQLWKLLTTPAWVKLNKHCHNVDSLIGKYVTEAEQHLNESSKEDRSTIQNQNNSIIMSMLLANKKMTIEDISTVLMDMLVLGVNSVTSTMSFLLYHLAKHQKCQRILRNEVDKVLPAFDPMNIQDLMKFKENTPYLQACIKETLRNWGLIYWTFGDRKVNIIGTFKVLESGRVNGTQELLLLNGTLYIPTLYVGTLAVNVCRLVPPIPLISRILAKNITLDKYNIPRGTLILMSLQDTANKELNFDDATRFYPERWLSPERANYHGFATIPFGYGARRCLGQNIAEIMMSLLTIKVMEKFKIEYHYGDIHPTKTFITKPDRPLKIRFIDRS